MALPSCVFCLFCCLPRLPGNQASVQACCGVSKQLIFPWAGPADDEDNGSGDNEDDGDDIYIMMKCVCVSRKIITSHF